MLSRFIFQLRRDDAAIIIFYEETNYVLFLSKLATFLNYNKILNMCRWDWFQDSTTNMKEKRKRRALENLQDSDRRQRLECIEPIKDGKGTEIKKREEASGQSQNNHDGEDEQDTEYEEESGESEEEQEGRQWTSQNVTLFTHQDFSSDDEENDAEESDESAVSRSTNFNSFRRILGRLRPTNRLTHIAPVESED